MTNTSGLQVSVLPLFIQNETAPGETVTLQLLFKSSDDSEQEVFVFGPDPVCNL